MDTKTLSQAGLAEVFHALGSILERRSLTYELVLVGGANLLLRGVIARPTKDGDLIGQRLGRGRVVALPKLPVALERAAGEVAVAYGLANDWLNVGPASLMDLGLPQGFEERLSPRRFGSLTLWLAGEYDMICFKLYAAADELPSLGRHMHDLRALEPSDMDLSRAAAWCLTQDASPGFASLLSEALRRLDSRFDGE
jgi:hypothetical protein